MTIFVNQKMVDMLGYMIEEMLGRDIAAYMFPEAVPDHTIRMQNRRQGRDESYERRFRP